MASDTRDHTNERPVLGGEAALLLERLETAMSGARIGWFQCDDATGVVSGSSSCATIFGLKNVHGPWRFEEFTNCVVPDDLAIYLAANQARATGMQSVRFRIRRGDDQLRLVESRFLDLADDELKSRVGLVLDVTDTNFLETRVRDYLEWLDLAVKSLNLVLWERDVKTDRFRSSTNYGGFYGLEDSRREWNYSEFLSRVHPEDVSMVIASYQSALETGEEYAPVYRVKMADGSYRAVEAKGRLQRDAAGKPIRVVGLSWDVSAKRQSEERLFGIARQVPGMVYQLKRDPKGIYTIPYCSEGIREICALEPEQVREDASRIMSRIHPDDVARLVQSVRESGDRLTPWHEEYRIVHPDTTVHWVEGRANPRRELDGSVLWHGHIVEITSRKRTEDELLKTRTRLTLALSAARMLSWHWDLATDQVTSSPDLGQFLGRNPGPRTMREFQPFVHPDDVARFSRLVHEISSEPPLGIVTIDYRLVCGSGETLSVESRAHGEFNAEGRLIGFHGATLDVTEQRQTERERNDLHDRLQQAQKMELIGLMTGGIAHDFNNILAIILGFAQLAQYSAAQSPGSKLVGYLAEIEQAGTRGAALVSQMLAFSRGEGADLSIQNLAPLVERAIKMLRPMFPVTVEFRTDLPADLPLLQVNPTHIQQIIMNLCINARDAMLDQGTITLTLKRVLAEEGACASCARPYAGDWVMLSVKDTGPGIPETIRPRMFEPFVTTKSAEQGTGMGLAMVHSIVHRNHGHLTLTSTTAGVEFRILLPVTVASDTEGVAPARSTVEARTLAQRRILVIEDERAIGAFLAERLSLEGHAVVVDSDPVEAVARFKAAPDQIDLVITDQTMPGMSGLEVLAQLHIVRPGMPVIVMTGFSRTVDAASASRLGVHALLQKPLDIDALLSAIETAIP